MKVVIQRVKNASVEVDNEPVGSIGKGLLVLTGIREDDTEEIVEWISEKLVKLRIFDDEEGKMNRSVQDVGGELLIVSQFTLYGNAEKGNRPSYINAAGPEKAEKLYNHMVRYLRDMDAVPVEEGAFGAYMNVSLVNDGPVTIVMSRES